MGTILLVDQDVDLLRELSQQLDNRGRENIVASSIKEAMNLVDDRLDTIERIVVSEQLGDGSAKEFIKMLGDVQSNATTAVLVDRLSAEVVLDLIQWFDFVVPKPLSAEQVHRLCAIMECRRLQPQMVECCEAFSQRFGLSPKESGLLSLAVRRLNNDEAAELLGCARSTIAKYWNRIFNKTMCRSQRDVIAAVLSLEIERRGRRSGTFSVAPSLAGDSRDTGSGACQQPAYVLKKTT